MSGLPTIRDVGLYLVTTEEQGVESIGSVLGWVAVVLLFWFIVSSVHGTRTSPNFNWMTLAQTYLAVGLVGYFLVADTNRAHLLWLVPAAFFVGGHVGMSGLFRPVLRLGARIILVGTGRIVDDEIPYAPVDIEGAEQSQPSDDE